MAALSTAPENHSAMSGFRNLPGCMRRLWISDVYPTQCLTWFAKSLDKFTFVCYKHIRKRSTVLRQPLPPREQRVQIWCNGCMLQRHLNLETLFRLKSQGVGLSGDLSLERKHPQARSVFEPTKTVAPFFFLPPFFSSLTSRGLSDSWAANHN